jgi:hypothetical protein
MVVNNDEVFNIESMISCLICKIQSPVRPAPFYRCCPRRDMFCTILRFFCDPVLRPETKCRGPHPPDLCFSCDHIQQLYRQAYDRMVRVHAAAVNHGSYNRPTPRHLLRQPHGGGRI